MMCSEKESLCLCYETQLKIPSADLWEFKWIWNLFWVGQISVLWCIILQKKKKKEGEEERETIVLAHLILRVNDLRLTTD